MTVCRTAGLSQFTSGNAAGHSRTFNGQQVTETRANVGVSALALKESDSSELARNEIGALTVVYGAPLQLDPGSGLLESA